MLLAVPPEIRCACTVVFRGFEPQFAKDPFAKDPFLSTSASIDESGTYALVTTQNATTPPCPRGVPVRDLPLDCIEQAHTPGELFEKLFAAVQFTCITRSQVRGKRLV